jgi:TolB-like protein
MRKGRHAIMILCVGMVLSLGGGVPEVEAAVEKTLERGAEVLAQEIAESLPQDKKPLLAVLDFSDLSDCVSAFGRLTSEELVTKLFKTKRARVVERGLLKKALAELKFNLSELVDPSRAKQLGKQVGADAIVSGTVSDLGASVKINARVIEVERGDVLAAAGVEIAKDESVTRLSNQILSCPGKGQKEPAKSVEEAPASPPVSKPTPTQAAMKVEVKNFLFALQECRKAGAQITCSLLITNLSDDRDIVLFGARSGTQNTISWGTKSSTKLFSAHGNVFIASAVRLGNQEPQDGSMVTFTLISKVPTRAVLRFEKVNADTNGIALLDVGFYTNEEGRAQFRDVPLVQ